MSPISTDDCRKRIDSKLSEYINALDCPDVLKSAMAYGVLGGGKRLRPLLLIAACELFGGDAAAAMPFACAVEFIHSYSLIHDDLPAMDDDGMRRGKPSNHILFGEWAAILAGDGLLSLAFEVMASHNTLYNDTVCVRAMAEIATASGASGMVGGQAADMENEGKDAGADVVVYICGRKTGALITASLTAGAILAGADEEDVAKIRKIGEKLGLAFQIRDDLLNIEGDPDKIGKPVGTDSQAGKATYASVFGITRAKSDYNSLRNEIINSISGMDSGESLLREVVNSVLNRV